MTTERKETALPFPGFYHSHYDHEFDHAVERDCEYLAEEWGVDPETLSEFAWDKADWQSGRERIARLHVEKWLEKFTDETGVDLTGGEFAGMTSPRFYNFETDRVFAAIPFVAIRECFKLCQADEFASLAAVVKDRFTSYDGFISFYSNDVAAWLEKPLREWDCNEVETLIVATVALFSDAREFNDSVIMAVIEYGSGNGEFDCVPWDEFKVAA